jgi:hypothetical protein
VPHALSLDATLLAVLPKTLREAAFSVAFDDGCLMDHSLPVQSYAFPVDMPNLHSLDLQVGSSGIPVTSSVGACRALGPHG